MSIEIKKIFEGLFVALIVYLFAFIIQELMTHSLRQMYCCYKMAPSVVSSNKTDASDAQNEPDVYPHKYALETLDFLLRARSFFIKKSDPDQTCLNQQLNATRCKLGIQEWNALFARGKINANPSQQTLSNPLMMWIPNALLFLAALFYAFLPDIFLASVCLCHPGMLSRNLFGMFILCGTVLRFSSLPF